MCEAFSKGAGQGAQGMPTGGVRLRGLTGGDMLSTHDEVLREATSGILLTRLEVFTVWWQAYPLALP